MAFQRLPVRTSITLGFAAGLALLLPSIADAQSGVSLPPATFGTAYDLDADDTFDIVVTDTCEVGPDASCIATFSLASTATWQVDSLALMVRLDAAPTLQSFIRVTLFNDDGVITTFDATTPGQQGTTFWTTTLTTHLDEIALAPSALAAALVGGSDVGVRLESMTSGTHLFDNIALRIIPNVPDLTVQAAFPVNALASNGFGYRVCNVGAGDVGSPVELHLVRSLDESLTAADPILTTATIPASRLQAGRCTIDSLFGSASSTTNAMYYGLIVDPTDQVAEFDETNNTSNTAPLGSDSGSDLTIWSLSEVQPLGMGSSHQQDLVTRICNLGDAYSSDFTLTIGSAPDSSPSLTTPYYSSNRGPLQRSACYDLRTTSLGWSYPFSEPRG